MADNKSSEDKSILGYGSGTDKYQGGSFLAGESGIDFASKPDRTVLGIRVDIDCSEALKGLKAIQREAKKATAALKEFEELVKTTPDTLGGRAISVASIIAMAGNGHKPHIVVFDEMHSMCPKCGSANREVNEIKSEPKELYLRKIECLDCGYTL